MSDTRENDVLSLCSTFDIVSNEKEENYKKEIKRLQKQLAIAVKALDSLRGICFPERAEKALKEIEELNK